MLSDCLRAFLPGLSSVSENGEPSAAAASLSDLALDAEAAREEAHLYLAAADQARREFREHMAAAASRRARIGLREVPPDSLAEIERFKQALDEAVQFSREEYRYRTAAYAAFERARLDHREILGIWRSLRQVPDLTETLNLPPSDHETIAGSFEPGSRRSAMADAGGAPSPPSRIRILRESTAAFRAALQRHAHASRSDRPRPRGQGSAERERAEPRSAEFEVVSADGLTTSPTRLSEVPPASLLTRRQREIAALIARGYTNRQIADQLFLSKGTVANHVEHILNRLGFQNRAMVASWAAALGLSTSDDLTKDFDTSN